MPIPAAPPPHRGARLDNGPRRVRGKSGRHRRGAQPSGTIDVVAEDNFSSLSQLLLTNMANQSPHYWGAGASFASELQITGIDASVEQLEAQGATLGDGPGRSSPSHREQRRHVLGRRQRCVEYRLRILPPTRVWRGEKVIAPTYELAKEVCKQQTVVPPNALRSLRRPDRPRTWTSFSLERTATSTTRVLERDDGHERAGAAELGRPPRSRCERAGRPASRARGAGTLAAGSPSSRATRRSSTPSTSAATVACGCSYWSGGGWTTIEISQGSLAQPRLEHSRGGQDVARSRRLLRGLQGHRFGWRAGPPTRIAGERPRSPARPASGSPGARSCRPFRANRTISTSYSRGKNGEPSKWDFWSSPTDWTTSFPSSPGKARSGAGSIGAGGLSLVAPDSFSLQAFYLNPSHQVDTAFWSDPESVR